MVVCPSAPSALSPVVVMSFTDRETLPRVLKPKTPLKDVPPIEVQLVEVPQPKSPYGIKGVGEIGLVPTAPAVAAALRDYDGQWRTSLPMRPKFAADD